SIISDALDTAAVDASTYRTQGKSGDLSAVPAGQRFLLKIIAKSVLVSGLQVTLVGHTNGLATEGYNLALAQGRVATVARELNNFGVPWELMRFYTAGEYDKPYADGVDALDGIDPNTNVEKIMIQCQKAASGEAPSENLGLIFNR